MVMFTGRNFDDCEPSEDVSCPQHAPTFACFKTQTAIDHVEYYNAKRRHADTEYSKHNNYKDKTYLQAEEVCYNDMVVVVVCCFYIFSSI